MVKADGELMIQGFNQFGGKHCWTAALNNVLDYHGLHLSEEMLFGLGGGIGFVYWHMKKMPAPFIGCRYGKGTEPLINTCKRIGAEATIFETTSAKKGYEELKRQLREGEPAFAFVDMPYLPYLDVPEAAHFGGHTVVVFGLDEQESKVYISDRAKNPVMVTIEDLKKARSSKFPPFPPKNRLLRTEFPSKVVNLERGIGEGIKECCADMLTPPIKNVGMAGMGKWAGLVPKWPKQFKGLGLLGCLFNTFVCIEIAGTGGSAFRPMYARFLKEASPILNKPALNDVAEMFVNSGEAWSEIAEASLPDSWPILRRIRELSFEKNRIFEEQKPGALEEMRRISNELDDLMKKTADDSKSMDLASLLSDLQQKILKCCEIESQAFQSLNSVIE